MANQNKNQANNQMALPPELNPDLCKDPKRKKVLMEIQALNTEYRELVKVKQTLIKKVQATDEEILKKIGAYQALKKILDTVAPIEEKVIVSPVEEECPGKEVEPIEGAPCEKDVKGNCTNTKCEGDCDCKDPEPEKTKE